MAGNATRASGGAAKAQLVATRLACSGMTDELVDIDRYPVADVDSPEAREVIAVPRRTAS